MESPLKVADISKIENMENSFKKQVSAYQRKRLKRQNGLISAVNRTYEMKMMKIPLHILNKPITMLTKGDFAYLENKEESKKPAKRTKSTLSEGKNNQKRVTRSQLHTVIKTEKFKTPVNQKAPTNLGMVTPKFNPYAPMSVLRMPKEGEIAMSISGSPLHVTSIINETKANVVVPLNDGKVLSVLPERGLRLSQIPEIDGDLMRQLQVLNENLNILLIGRH